MKQWCGSPANSTCEKRGCQSSTTRFQGGNTIEKYEYSVYGKVNIVAKQNGETRPASVIGNPYYFTGRRLDTETGLYYYRARMYSASLGRFLQTDPIGYADGINWYLYCSNNPVAWVDPWGLCGESSWFSKVGDTIGYGVTAARKRIYTGDWNAPDEVYDGAVEGLAEFLWDVSPIRGVYISAGYSIKKHVGVSGSASWTMEGGTSVAGRASVKVIDGPTNKLGFEGGFKWRPGEGTIEGTHQWSYERVGGFQAKVDENDYLKFGTVGPVRIGVHLDVSRFEKLGGEWKNILGW